MEHDEPGRVAQLRSARIHPSSFDDLAIISWFLQSKDVDDAIRGVLRWASLDMGRFLTEQARAEIISRAREQDSLS